MSQSPLRHAKLLVNRLLSPLGVGIHRVRQEKRDANAVVTVTLGEYSIQVPAINPLSTHYSFNPNYSSQLGRLTALLRKKYPDTAAIDIGANVGDTACIIKSAGDVPILCIEGDEYCFDFLQGNIAQFKNVTAHRLFLGEKTGAISAVLDKAGWNTTIQPGETGAAQKVQITTLDDFLADKPRVENYKLLKIDTEGFDCAILRGATGYIRRVQPAISFEYNRENMNKIGEGGLDTLFMLAGLGYGSVAFHDSEARFVCMANLNDRKLIGDLHDYADGKCRAIGIYYYDVTLFSDADADLASLFAEKERALRASGA